MLLSIRYKSGARLLVDARMASIYPPSHLDVAGVIVVQRPGYTEPPEYIPIADLASVTIHDNEVRFLG